jgi:hypothetical protein
LLELVQHGKTDQRDHTDDGDGKRRDDGDNDEAFAAAE